MEQALKIYIDDVLLELKQREQSILKLYYFAGFTEVEIAESYQISQPRLHKIKERALQKCRKLIKEKKPFVIIA